SGGYFIAVGGDEIFADPSSIVGSIGVIYAGFGFEEAISRIGVKRRIHTAGKSKSQLDPFVPEKKADVERLKAFEQDIHQVFIDHVKLNRGNKLTAEDDILFTGEWWTGLRGLELGLIDEIGDMHTVLRERYGEDIKLKQIAPKKRLFSLPRIGFSSTGALDGVGGELLGALQDKALWSRFGL
ncbi:macromolecule metabolism; macromolecule degradation; degradation of proteins, peptides, glycopeptides, partial [hydrothermal vent metagenome]